jgi:hypothetical protein
MSASRPGAAVRAEPIDGSSSGDREIREVSPELGRRVLRVGLVSVWAYVWVALVFREPFVPGGGVGAAAVFVLLAAALLVGTKPAPRTRLPPSRMLEVGLVMISLLLAVLCADVVYAVYQNALRARSYAPTADEVRLTDRNVWHGELFPRAFHPTPGTFALYKPNVDLSAEVYGEYYHPSMLASPTLRDSVLERRDLSYAIGPLGLRERESLAAARIFALGDSFVLGYATGEGKIWPDLLGFSLGEPVYNLGVSATGPRLQLELLRHLLATHGDSMRVGRLLWMIFEGNDLENSYAVERHPAAATGGAGVLLDGTVLQPLLSLPGRIKNQSIARKLVARELRFDAPPVLSGDRARYEIDGVALTVPLYHSSRWGYRLFNRDDVARASASRDYVLSHPNRPLLDETFREMRALSERHGFAVTVIVAPSDVRLYGREFAGLPTPSAEPHFARYVLDLARGQGFATVDLLTLLQPHAAREMLYYRDDHHWNVRGNAVVADLLARTLRGGGEGL